MSEANARTPGIATAALSPGHHATPDSQKELQTADVRNSLLRFALSGLERRDTSPVPRKRCFLLSIPSIIPGMRRKLMTPALAESSVSFAAPMLGASLMWNKGIPTRVTLHELDVIAFDQPRRCRCRAEARPPEDPKALGEQIVEGLAALRGA